MEATAMTRPPYGDLGILASHEDKVQCHICGKWFRGLNNHVLRSHGWTADEYREEFQLNRKQGLIGSDTREKLREINKRLGNWRHLPSLTRSKEENRQFLRSVGLKPGYKMRQQTLLVKSKSLKIYNPMNEPEAQERARTKLHESWYGSPAMRALSRQNLAATIRRRRENALRERKYTCPCGEAFPIRKDGEHHRRYCSVARAVIHSAQAKARKSYWVNLAKEKRELHRKHISEGRIARYSKQK